jgi:hypothetical protein
MLALFQGIPQLVFLEEPHHGVQFGVNQNPGTGAFEIDLRTASGDQVRAGGNPIPIPVPVRSGHHRVIHVSALRRALHEQQQKFHPEMPPQNGSGSFAIEVLQVPWRQRFEGTVDMAEKPSGSGSFVSVVMINSRVALGETRTELSKLIKGS